MNAAVLSVCLQNQLCLFDNFACRISFACFIGFICFACFVRVKVILIEIYSDADGKSVL